MIKYVEFDSIDETGQHIVPVNSLYELNKIAGGTYSPEIMRVIHSIKRDPNRYYVVINALGSYEVWGANRNGDAFPEAGLTHVSLRTDMGTPNDYGYKTFEYYAKWFRNHVNKSDSPSFGEVVFSHWNPAIHRVELIVAIDAVKDAETIKALDSGELVSVSMGARLPYDVCAICGNQAKTRKEYCIHAQNHLGEIVTEDLARKWSMQTGKKIIPGMQVFVWNYKPKFFDISKVYIGADRTSYILGKAASKRTKAVSSLNLAEAYGITDSVFEKTSSIKISSVKKTGEIDKEIGGALGPSDIDGSITSANPTEIIGKAVNENVGKSIAAEPVLPQQFLDGLAKTQSLPSIFSTMLGLGIFPKPMEVQRIVLVSVGQKPLADSLEANNEVFDYTSNENPMEIPDSFDDSISRMLVPFMAERSACPHFLLPRLKFISAPGQMDKTAFYSSTMGNDYWVDPNPQIGLPKPSIISPAAAALAGVAALYAGLKAKSLGMNSEQMASIFVNKPWLAALIGGGVMLGIYKMMQKEQDISSIIPATAYADRLQNTNFSGHIKQSALDPASKKFVESVGRGVITAGIAFPAAYFANAMNQRSMMTKGYPMLPVQNIDPPKTSLIAGVAAGLGPSIIGAMKKGLKAKAR